MYHLGTAVMFETNRHDLIGHFVTKRGGVRPRATALGMDVSKPTRWIFLAPLHDTALGVPEVPSYRVGAPTLLLHQIDRSLS